MSKLDYKHGTIWDCTAVASDELHLGVWCAPRIFATARQIGMFKIAWGRLNKDDYGYSTTWDFVEVIWTVLVTVLIGGATQQGGLARRRCWVCWGLKQKVDCGYSAAWHFEALALGYMHLMWNGKQVFVCPTQQRPNGASSKVLELRMVV